MRRSIGIVLALLSFLALTIPLTAITWGRKDVTLKYPEVGTIVYKLVGADDVGLACSGTLISPRVFLTAGHCTDAFHAYSSAFEHIWVSFDLAPLEAGATWHEVDKEGGIKTQPGFSGLRPLSNPHDLGIMLLLDDAAGVALAQLPPEGYLDALEAQGLLGHGTNGAKMTMVGYGCSLSFPPPRMYNENVRQFGDAEFRTLLPAWLRLSQQGRTGDAGGCPGDSGGPTFWQDPVLGRVLVATTSWGDTANVASAFNYRVDLAESLAFINTYR